MRIKPKRTTFNLNRRALRAGGLRAVFWTGVMIPALNGCDTSAPDPKSETPAPPPVFHEGDIAVLLEPVEFSGPGGRVHLPAGTEVDVTEVKNGILILEQGNLQGAVHAGKARPTR